MGKPFDRLVGSMAGAVTLVNLIANPEILTEFNEFLTAADKCAKRAEISLADYLRSVASTLDGTA